MYYFAIDFFPNLWRQHEQHLVTHIELQRALPSIRILFHSPRRLRQAVEGLLDHFLLFSRELICSRAFPACMLFCHLIRSQLLLPHNQLRWAHPCCRRTMDVVANLSHIQQVYPILLAYCHIVSQIFLLQCIHPLRLSIRLRMIGCRKLQICPH